jgi:ketosteroid isomerase-like protein
MSSSEAKSSNSIDTIAANKATVTEFFESWAAGHFDRVEQLLDPAGDWWTLASRKTRTMQAQMVRNKGVWTDATNGIAFRIDILTAEEDRVAAVVESFADFGDQGHYNNLYHFLFRVVDARIVQAWAYYDTALANRVLRGEGGGVPVASHAND